MRPATLALSAFMILLPVAVPKAAMLTVEPDDFAAGTNISTVNPAVRLSVVDHSDAVVTAAVGQSGNCGPNPPNPCASTGLHVFGGRSFWQRGAGELRADFTLPTNFVAIDLVGLDDGGAELRAFASDGTHLDTFSVFLTGPGHNVTAFIDRPSRDIAYILAAGVPGEGIGLDRLQFEVPGPSVPTQLRGPLQDSGSGALEPFADIDGDEVPDEGHFIVVGAEQYFSFAIDITNHGAAGDLDNLAFVQELPDEFILSREAEKDSDDCADGVCDGISKDIACLVTLSGPPARRGKPDLRFVVVEANLEPGITCRTVVHVKTRRSPPRFEPRTCSFVEIIEGAVTNTVDLGGDIKLFDTLDDRLIAVIGDPIQLRVIDCSKIFRRSVSMRCCGRRATWR